MKTILNLSLLLWFMIDFFPYDDVRPVQSDLINCVVDCLSNKKHLVVHAPTGLGKTVSTIVPALNVAVKKDLKILFLTSRNTQHKIVIDTVKHVNERFDSNFVVSSIIGKKWMCAQDNVVSMGSSDFLGYCKLLRENKSCEFYLNSSQKNPLFSLSIDKVLSDSSLDHDDLVSLSKENKVCPFEVALSVAKKSNVIVADYNYAVNSSIRQVLLNKLDKNLGDFILIFDEAHNIPSRVRDLMTGKLSDFVIRNAVSEAKKFNQLDCIDVLVQLQDILNSLSVNLISGSEKLVDKSFFIEQVNSIKAYDEIISDFAHASSLVVKEKKKSFLSMVGDFLVNWKEGDVGFARIISLEKDHVVLTNRCLDPSMLLKDVIDNSYCSIFMSGTLTPALMFKKILGLPEDSLVKEFPSPFPKENKLDLIVPSVTTKYSSRSEDQFSKIGSICSGIINSCGVTVVFFPSYGLRDMIGNFIIKNCDRTVLLEQPDMSKEQRQDLLKRFVSYKTSGVVLLGVTSGSFGEGIDLPGIIDCVVIVGMPFEVPNLEIKELIKYYDLVFGQGWEFGYNLPAFSKCFQNAGRCIRSSSDRGVIVYLDERYAWPKYMKYFPKGINLKITKDPVSEVKKFFGNS